MAFQKFAFIRIPLILFRVFLILLGADVSLLEALLELCFLCSSFNLVKVVKVPRLVVKAAHDKATTALKRSM